MSKLLLLTTAELIGAILILDYMFVFTVRPHVIALCNMEEGLLPSKQSVCNPPFWAWIQHKDFKPKLESATLIYSYNIHQEDKK